MAETFSVKAILSAVDKGFSATMRSARESIGSLKSTVSSGIGFGVMMAAGEKAFETITGGVTSLVGEMNSASAAWKTFQGNMEMNGHTAAEIKSIKGELQDFAEATIYSSSDMASTFAQLEAVGTKNTTKLVKGFGGLAAAAENPTQAMKTLSQQATQMAAKPTVAWEDFKLMVEQTPAGIAAVAKELGMSTQEMIKNVQDGQIATEDFFDAIAKVGTNDAFTKLATEYKTVGQAMDGLSETAANKLQPAFDTLSAVGIKAISGLVDKVGELDGNAINAALSVDNLKSAAIDLGVVLGGAAVAFEGNDVFGAAISGAKEYGLTLSNAWGKIQSLSSQTASSISGIGSKLKNISVDSLTQKATKGVNRLNRTFKGLGKSIDSYGGDVASAFEAISTKFSDKGIAVWEKFAAVGEKVSKSSSKMSSSLKKHIKSASNTIGNFTERVYTIAKPFEGIFSGIGSGIQKSAGIGIKAMNGMVSSLTSIMGVAMSALGPAAIVGVVLAGMGVLNSRFGGEIDSLIQTVTTKGPQIIGELVNSITSKLPALMQSGAQMISGLMDAVTANLPSVINGGVQIINSLVQGVGANIGTLLPSAINLVSTFARGIVSALPQLLLTGMKFLQSLSEGVLNNIDLIVRSASGIVQSFVGSVMSNLPSIITAGLQILTNLAQGAVQAMPRLLVVGLNAITTLITGIAGQLPRILQTGVQLIQMLIQGVVQNLPSILTAAIQAITTFVQGIVQNLPSIISSGIQIVGSLIGGLIQMLPSIVSAGWELIKSLGSGIIEAIPNIITGAVEGIKGIFSDLWGFITGKNKESSDKTASDLAVMTENVKTSVSTMGTDVSSSISTLNSNTATTIGNLTGNVESSFASMNGTAVSEASRMMNGVTNSLSGMNSLGSADMSGLAKNIISSAGDANASASDDISDMANNVNNSMSDIQNSVTKGMNKLPTVAKTSMSQFASSLRVGFNQALSVSKSSVTSIVSSMRSGYSGAYSSGRYIGQGLANGMRSMLGTVRSVAAQLAAAADAAIRAKARIHSPSKVSKKDGAYWGEGWVLGILSKVKDTRNAITELLYMPKMGTPALSLAGTNGLTLNDDYEYGEPNHTYTIYVISELDGKQVAKSTAVYTQKELEKLEKQNNRKHGIR